MKATSLRLSMVIFGLASTGISDCNAGAPGALKLHHVTGTQVCISDENWGYRCDVEIRDAVDCGSGHSRLAMVNCCGWQQINGKKQTNARNQSYIAKGCSPLF